MINPVIEREFKTKMRSWRSPAILAFYLVVLTLVVLIVYQTSSTNFNAYNSPMMEKDMAYPTSYNPSYNSGFLGGITFPPLVAVQIFNIVALFELILIIFIVPTLTGGAISGERERQTLDLMLSTNFTPFKIILGKIVSSISHVSLLILAALPFMGLILLYGGIGFFEIFKLILFLVVIATMASCIGVYFSTVFKRSWVSIIMTYLTMLVFTLGTIIFFWYWSGYLKMELTGFYSENTPMEMNAILFANPFYGITSIIPETGGNPFLPVTLFTRNLFESNNMSKFLYPFAVNLYFNILIILFFVVAAVERLKPIKSKLFKKRNKIQNNPF